MSEATTRNTPFLKGRSSQSLPTFVVYPIRTKRQRVQGVYKPMVVDANGPRYKWPAEKQERS